MASVTFDNATRLYPGGTRPAVDKLNLEVGDGEFLVLVGPSGCGKSTTLRMLAGLEPVDEGEILIDCKDVSSTRPRDRDVAMVFQSYALMPWLSVADNVGFGLAALPAGERRERAGELLRLVHLGDAADLRPHQLSGGMRQRVALARALAQDRPLLLMDEPFAALDAITRDLLHGELERVWRQTGRTVVFVTHNVAEAVRLGQRVLLLSSRPGRVVAEWDVPAAARHDAPAAAALTAAITARLGQEIRRHAH